MTGIIIDDDPNSHEVLKYYFTNYHLDIEILADGYSVEEGFKLIRRHRPDLVFLDIEMPDGEGFDLLKKLERPDFYVIFITGYQHYALRAIKFEALDYLLKPISEEDLERALVKARRKIHEKLNTERLEKLLDSLQKVQQQELPSRFGISTMDGTYFMPVRNILYLEANTSYTIFYLIDNSRKIASINLGEYEEQFKPYQEFMRVHRSYLVNLQHVLRLVKGDRKWSLVMPDDREIKVSKLHREELMRRLPDF